MNKPLTRLPLITLVALLFLLSAPAWGQAGTTAVTAHVADSNGSAYINCQWSVVFVGENTTPGAGPYAPDAYTRGQQGNCDSFGNFTINLGDNVNTMTPTPSQWSFSICSAPMPTGPFCKANILITITGATQDISAVLAAALPIISVPGGSVGIGLNNVFTGNNTFTALTTFSNAGVFTNTQMNEYVRSIIGGCSALAEYQRVQGFSAFASEAISACITSPNGATNHQSNAIAGYASTNNGGLGGFAVGGYFSSACLVTGSHCTGSNSVVIDVAGMTSIGMTGNETDCQPQNAASVYINGGVICNQSVLYAPTAGQFGFAYVAAKSPSLAGQFKYAFGVTPGAAQYSLFNEALGSPGGTGHFNSTPQLFEAQYTGPSADDWQQQVVTNDAGSISIFGISHTAGVSASNFVQVPGLSDLGLTSGQEFTVGTSGLLGSTYPFYHNSSTALSALTGAQLMALSGCAATCGIGLDPGTTTNIPLEMDIGTNNAIPQTIIDDGGLVSCNGTTTGNCMVLGQTGRWKSNFGASSSAGSLITVPSGANVTSAVTTFLGATTLDLEDTTLNCSGTSTIQNGLVWVNALEGKGALKNDFLQGCNNTYDLVMTDGTAGTSNAAFDNNNITLQNDSLLGTGSTGASLNVIGGTGTGQGAGYVFSNVSTGNWGAGTIYPATVNFDGSAAFVSGTVTTSNGAIGGCASNCAQAVTGTWGTSSSGMPAGTNIWIVIGGVPTLFTTNATPISSTIVQLTSAPGTNTAVPFYGFQSNATTHVLNTILWDSLYDEEPHFGVGNLNAHQVLSLKNVRDTIIHGFYLGAGDTNGLLTCVSNSAQAAGNGGYFEITGRANGRCQNSVVDSNVPTCTGLNTPVAGCSASGVFTDTDNDFNYRNAGGASPQGFVFAGNMVVTGTATHAAITATNITTGNMTVTGTLTYTAGITPRFNTCPGNVDTILSTDRAQWVWWTDAAPCAVALPQAGIGAFGQGFIFKGCNSGAGTVTITPNTSTISFNTGSAFTSAAANMTLTTGQCADIGTDNVNYFAVRR